MDKTSWTYTIWRVSVYRVWPKCDLQMRVYVDVYHVAMDGLEHRPLDVTLSTYKIVYSVFKKSCPFLYHDKLYKNGQDILNKQWIDVLKFMFLFYLPS